MPIMWHCSVKGVKPVVIPAKRPNFAPRISAIRESFAPDKGATDYRTLYMTHSTDKNSGTSGAAAQALT
jgi:hypothetical protein